MNITKENTGNLTAIVRVQIEPADYQETVDKQINDYKRKANIPGFRPGHVPTGLIRKMYGKALMADEVNKLVSNGLLDFIRKENLNILGNPIPSDEKNSVVDFDHQESFDFFFDIGFAPEFSLSTDLTNDVTKYMITVSDEMVEKYITSTRTLPKKQGENENSEDNANDAEKVEEPQLAELNPEFFDQVFPGQGIETEEAFVEQVRKDARTSFANETDKLLFSDITDALVKNTVMELPDAFLKRWLLESNDDKFTPEQIEADYPKFVNSMKWQLIENKIIKDNNIEVTDEDIRNHIRTYFFRQLNVSDENEEMKARYESLIDTLMENKEQVQRINDQLYNERLMAWFKANLQYGTSEITYDEYIALATKKMGERASNHDHDHDHHDDHDHDHLHDHEHGHDHHH
jgi:trigger factor